jgi:Na+-transporting NADH:ubiquinone oxidoreductase subunit NqrB
MLRHGRPDQEFLMLRSLFAIVSGLFAMMIVITFSELANAKFFFPLPAGLDLNDAATVAAYAATMPASAMAAVLAGWLLGAFIGAGVAAKIAEHYRLGCALLIGAIDVALTAMNALSIPHPAWVIAAGVLLPIPLAWLAATLVQKGFARTR